MKIAVASGKGGTGKTTVVTHLAFVASGEGRKVQVLDCDVEEPNGHLFLEPVLDPPRTVTMPVPEIDDDLCNYCGECGAFCAFSAILCIKDKVLTFPELCHACGGCALVCPTKAISEVGREIGTVEEGRAGDIAFAHGTLRIGEAMSPPLIRAVKELCREDVDLVLLDAPPGTSCPVIESIRGADFLLLVTEPTPFGLWDLGLALDMAVELDIPHGVVVNRHLEGNDTARVFAKERGVEILAEIPDDRRIAELYSRGIIAASELPELRPLFIDLLKTLDER